MIFYNDVVLNSLIPDFWGTWKSYHLNFASQAGVSVKFLMVGETNFMVGYHWMAKGHSVQLGVWGGDAVSPPQQVQGSTLIGVRIFLKFFLNLDLKNIWKAKNRCILSLRME